MAQNDLDQLADAIVRRLKDQHHAIWLDPETHAEQHEFLKLLMQERAERIARRKRIEEKIVGSIVLSGIVVVIGLIGAGVLAWLEEKLKRPEQSGGG